MVKIFGVDAIPHVAFITNKAEVQTALVGAVPKKIMVEQVSALVLVSYYSIRMRDVYLNSLPTPTALTLSLSHAVFTFV